MAFNQSLAVTLVTQDHLRNILSKSGHANAKKAAAFAPVNSHSCFGDFPEGFGV